MRPIHEHEAADKESAEMPKLNKEDMVKTFDAINSYLRVTLGETKIPLAYVTREEPEVLPPALDPANGYQRLTWR
jgi:hypothetical protein